MEKYVLELQNFIQKLFQQIIVIPSLFITDTSRNKAHELCKDIDIKDIVYVALSVEMNITLVTSDKPLYNGLKAKKFEKVIMLDEFIRQQFKED